MKELLRLREQYGPAYAIQLPGGKAIPFRLLTLGEYLEYENLIGSKTYPYEQIEDEIFKKCVLDQSYLDFFNLLPAGEVSSTVSAIRAYSGPSSAEQFNLDLDIARRRVDSGIHDMVGTICRAFPSYKPEDVYGMNYDTFVIRVAQAERLLIQAGILTEPVVILSPEPQKQRIKPPRMVNPKQVYEDQQKPLVPPPLPPTATERTIITKKEMQAHDTELGPDHDKIMMAKQTVGVYQDYIEQLKEGKEIVIYSDEDRLRIAQERAEKNKENLRKKLEQEKVQFKKDMAKALEERKKIKRRRKHK